jgi:lysophospholipase L1-like esterase
MSALKSTRRNFIKNASIGAIASLSVPQIVSAAFEKEITNKISIKKGSTILFQGDSITEWWRLHGSKLPNTTSALGAGYVMMIAGQLLVNFTDKNLQIYNKGNSGDKVYQLADRWDADCLQYKPDIISILIGVNDYWHTLTHDYKGTIQTYITDYHKLIERTKQALPDVKLVIGEPFAIKGVKYPNDSWYPTFNLFRKAARDIATQYKATFVPFQSVFDKAILSAPPPYWSLDGVHPSVPGEVLMTQAWMQAVV